MEDKAIQLIELKAQYRLLGEIEELWLRKSSSKFFKEIQRKKQTILQSIIKIEKSKE